jgi:exopolysaccharide biosynthesis polyprenyl glycosylphosphotransferase
MAISHVLPDHGAGDADTVPLPLLARREWSFRAEQVVPVQDDGQRRKAGTEHERPSVGSQPTAAASLRHFAAAGALPLADLLALGAAITLSRTATGPAAGYAAAVLAVLAISHQHRLKITPRVSDQAGRIAVAAALPALGLLPWLPAGAAIRLALLSTVTVGCGRAAAHQVLRAARSRGSLSEAVVIVGTGTMAAELAGLMHDHAELGLRPVGFAGERPTGPGLPLPLLGAAADLPVIVRQHRIRRVIVTAAADGDAALLTALRRARELPTDICVVPRLSELGTAVPRSVLDEIWGVPLLPLRRMGAPARLVKRAFDISISLTLLVALGPLIALLAAVTWWQLRRPALFRQIRLTGPGRQAEVLKLRTMGHHGNPDTCWTVPPQRSTAFGRFLRSTHLDELPQLGNVALGQMSLVGPRPERPYFAARFAQEIPGYADRLRMTAGLTGWAQVHGLNGDTSIRDRVRFDNAYIENWSLWLDLVIVARTATGLLAGAVAQRVTGPPGPRSSTAEPLATATAWRPASLQGDRS